LVLTHGAVSLLEKHLEGFLWELLLLDERLKVVLVGVAEVHLVFEEVNDALDDGGRRHEGGTGQFFDGVLEHGEELVVVFLAVVLEGALARQLLFFLLTAGLGVLFVLLGHLGLFQEVALHQGQLQVERVQQLFRRQLHLLGLLPQELLQHDLLEVALEDFHFLLQFGRGHVGQIQEGVFFLETLYERLVLLLVDQDGLADEFAVHRLEAAQGLLEDDELLLQVFVSGVTYYLTAVLQMLSITRQRPSRAYYSSAPSTPSVAHASSVARSTLRSLDEE
jgi:hypothetical protein